ncbi:hypothetical protein Tco_0158729 [Tanacetum coccineum]
MDSFQDLLKKVPHHGIDLWLQLQIFYDHVNPVTRRTIDESVGGKLRDRIAKESRALLEDLALYNNESWNNPKDCTKPVKAISLPQDVPSTSDRCLIKLENQVQCLMEAHLAPKQPVQVNKITSSCEICSGPHDTQYYMENPEQAFFKYASSRIDEAEEKVRKLNSFLESFKLVPQSPNIEFVCTKEDDGDVLFIEIIRKYDDSREEELEEDENTMTEGLGSMEEEEVPLVDGVFEGALGALALEMEALVDAMVVYSG